MGLRLQLRKAQAEAGDIILLYGDESEALTHPYLARAWAKRGADLRVPAPGQAKKVAIIGSLDHVTRQLIVHTSPTKRSSDFIAHLEQLDFLYGPQPGRVIKPVVLVEDNGPIHVSKLTLKASEARKHWLTVEWLPKYAPELNDIEVVWHDLKAHHLAHQTFADADALDRAIHAAVAALNHERTVNPLVNQRISRLAPNPERQDFVNELSLTKFAMARHSTQRPPRPCLVSRYGVHWLGRRRGSSPRWRTRMVQRLALVRRLWQEARRFLSAARPQDAAVAQW